MRLNTNEKNLIQFLKKYPNRWHTYNMDKTTMRTVGTLLVIEWTGNDSTFTINTNTGQVNLIIKKVNGELL